MNSRPMRGSDTSSSWAWAPGTRGGLLIAVSGVAALVATGQIASPRVGDGSSAGVTSSAVAVAIVVVVGYVSRLVPFGSRYLRHDVGVRFSGTVYGASVLAAVVAVSVTEVWLTVLCLGAHVLLVVLVARRPAETSDRPEPGARAGDRGGGPEPGAPAGDWGGPGRRRGRRSRLGRATAVAASVTPLPVLLALPWPALATVGWVSSALLAGLALLAALLATDDA